MKRTETVGARKARSLLMAYKRMEFLPASSSGAPVSEDIAFPVLVSVTKGRVITVQVLTMQSDVGTWGRIVDSDLRRVLTFVTADKTYDQVLSFMAATLRLDTGDYVDISVPAVDFMNSDKVDTYSGAFEVGSVGTTKHGTVRGRGRRPLRESMRAQFNRLVGADRVVRAELQLNQPHLGLAEGSKVKLHPTVGKLVFRSNLGGGDLDEFMVAMARP